MSDSLLDQALHFCNAALTGMCDTPERSQLKMRLDVLERATWSVPLLHGAEQKLVRIAKLVLALRDDVAAALAAQSTPGERTLAPRSLPAARASGDLEPPPRLASCPCPTVATVADALEPSPRLAS